MNANVWRRVGKAVSVTIRAQEKSPSSWLSPTSRARERHLTDPSATDSNHDAGQ
jgi:hypothetical protein